jgi:diphosphomevalonate decarboxylase
VILKDVVLATACANIALVKYWGKRDSKLNLPAAGSLSLTLDALRTFTRLELIEGDRDQLVLDGKVQTGPAAVRVSEFLDRVRNDAPPELRRRRASVRTRNAFPSASGLASSASGFAALAVAANAAYSLERDPTALSRIARIGSGSAARSIFGGFVRMDPGRGADGSDAVARPISVGLTLSAAIVVAQSGPKEVGSTDGMEHTRKTSPYHASWISLVEQDLGRAETALAAGDLEQLAEVVEGNCLAMHADAMAARPGILYFRAVTLWAIDRVRALRKAGLPVFFTIDAGPHVVALTVPSELGRVGAELAVHPGVDRVILSHSGGPASTLAEQDTSTWPP